MATKYPNTAWKAKFNVFAYILVQFQTQAMRGWKLEKQIWYADPLVSCDLRWLLKQRGV